MRQNSLLIGFFAFFSTFTYSQKIDYGLILGMSAYDVEINGDVSGGTGLSGLNIGIFGDYQLNNSFGIKANLLYVKMTEDAYTIANAEPIFDEVKLTQIQIHTLIKCDVNRSYNKGFYFVGGLRLSNIISIKEDNSVNDPNEFFKKSVVGAMLGFGIATKYSSFEIIPERNITNTIDYNDNTARNYGIYVNATVNLSEILRENKL